jgi:histidinol dehydrogenase
MTRHGHRVCDALAPGAPGGARRTPSALRRFKHYGGLFLGHGAAEVLGDYGAGPNHVLPTGGTARHVAA